MSDSRWIYLAQLTRALGYENVDGGRAGEFVAEIAGHLSETEKDPVAELGPPHELAAEFADRPGTRRPGWVPPIWALILVAALAGSAGAVAADALLEGWDERGIPIRAYPALVAGSLVLISTTVGYLATRRLDGRSWSSFSFASAGLAAAAAAVAYSLIHLTRSTVIERVSPTLFWVATVAIIVLLLLVIHKRHNPIRFPAHARHLDRLKRGPLAGRPPAGFPG